LPSLQLIFFVLVDGGRLVAGSLVANYGVGITTQ
jgi:flagellar biosynthesis protein FliP